MTDEQKKAIKLATIRRTRKIRKKEKFSTENKMTWEEFPEGGIIPESGNSDKYITGNWVPEKLVFNPDTCINCGLCWPVCPDDAIILDEEGNMKGVDLEHCKDCGICVEVCPTKEKSLYFEKGEARNI